MKVTFDFRSVKDANDCHTMFTAFGWAHTLHGGGPASIHRIVAEYEPNSFGAMAGEAGVFAPVQITVEP